MSKLHCRKKMFHPVPTFTENLTFPFYSFWIIFKWRWRAHSVWWVHTLNNKFILQSTGKAFLNKAWLLSNDEICEEISPLVPSCSQWSAIFCVLNCSAILTQDEPTLYLSLDRIPDILFPTFVNFQVERIKDKFNLSCSPYIGEWEMLEESFWDQTLGVFW